MIKNRAAIKLNKNLLCLETMSVVLFVGVFVMVVLAVGGRWGLQQCLRLKRFIPLALQLRIWVFYKQWAQKLQISQLNWKLAQTTAELALPHTLVGEHIFYDFCVYYPTPFSKFGSDPLAVLTGFFVGKKTAPSAFVACNYYHRNNTSSVYRLLINEFTFTDSGNVWVGATPQEHKNLPRPSIILAVVSPRKFFSGKLTNYFRKLDGPHSDFGQMRGITCHQILQDLERVEGVPLGDVDFLQISTITQPIHTPRFTLISDVHTALVNNCTLKHSTE